MQNEEDEWKAFAEAVRIAMQHKSEMLKAGERQRIAVCPKCQGSLRLLLAGPRNHVRMFCRDCRLQAME